jgi:hypothetical protein
MHYQPAAAPSPLLVPPVPIDDGQETNLSDIASPPRILRCECGAAGLARTGEDRALYLIGPFEYRSGHMVCLTCEGRSTSDRCAAADASA